MVSYSRGTPGLSLERLFSEVSPSRLESLIPAHVWGLARRVDPSFISGNGASRLLARTVDPTVLLSDASTRQQVLDLLPVDKANELVTRLELPATGNPYKALSTMHWDSEATTELLSFFGVNAVERAPIAPQPEVENAPVAYGLFAHQRDLVRRVEYALNNRTRRLLVHMPTGSGKTRTAMNVVARHLANSEPRFAIWLAQSSELLEQAAQEFIRAWRHLGNRHLPMYRYWGPYAPTLDSIQDGFLVCGFAKLYAALKRDPNLILRLGDHASLIVVDEAHQSIATTYKEMIDALLLKRPVNKLIGLSATPGRTWNDVAVDAELAQFFEGEKLTIEIPGYEDPVRYLVEEGYLARAQFRNLASEGKADLTGLDDSEGDIPEEALQRLGEDEDRNIQILHAIEDLFTRHSRVILFAASVAHAKLISALLSLRGYDSSVITATTDPITREALIRRFKNEDQTKRIICNYGVLTTGFDAPKTSAALIARPTRSLVLFSQMVGRAIRGPKAGGNATCEIMTIVDPSLPGFGSVAEAFSNWEDVWA